MIIGSAENWNTTGLDLLRELDPHAERMPKALMGHVSTAKLRQLTTLLAEVLDGIGTYP